MDFLKQVEGLLDMPPGEKETVLRELRSHYDEIRLQLEEEGYSEEVAAEKAAARLGTATDIAFTLNREHCVSSWKTAILTAVPFLAVGALELAMHLLRLGRWTKATLEGGTVVSLASVSPMYVAASLLLTVLFLGGSLRELKNDRRPLWSVTWLAGGLLFLLVTAFGTFGAFGSLDAIRHHMPVLALLYFGSSLTLAIAGCWSVPHWRMRVVGAASISAVLLVGSYVWWSSTTGIAFFLALICFGYVLWFAFAIGVFQHHRYGSPFLASLFLISTFWGMGIMGRIVNYTHVKWWWPTLQLFLSDYGSILGLVFAAAVFIAVARASKRNEKGQILGWSAAVWGVVTAEIPGFWLMTMLAFWIPKAIDNRNRKKELGALYAESSHGVTT